MTDAIDLNAAVERTRSWHAKHLETCPTCLAAQKANIVMWTYTGCPELVDLREDALQADRRLIAQNALARGDRGHARRIEWIIEQVEEKRRGRPNA
jgi:hypothetical protein